MPVKHLKVIFVRSAQIKIDRMDDAVKKKGCLN